VIPFGVGSPIMMTYLRSSRSIIRLNFHGVAPRWALFADILKVGVPGLLNTAITNLSVVILTGIAGQSGPQAAIGYAIGSRLEYIMQPIAFGFGTAIVAMVGTNWGAQDDAEVARLGAMYLRIVGPVYVCFGLGLALFFVCQGYGRGFAAMTANAVRLLVSAGAGLAAVYWLGLSVNGLFAAIAAGFCIYAALTTLAVIRVSPPATPV
jgi:Na+-driven multidrug efflux pump